MTLGATQQSTHRVLHRRGDVRPSAAFALRVMMMMMMLMAMLLLMVLMRVLLLLTMLAHRLVVVHHFLQPRRRRRGCHFVATRLHHVHRVVHVRSNPAGFLAVRPLNEDDDSLQTPYRSQGWLPGVATFHGEASRFSRERSLRADDRSMRPKMMLRDTLRIIPYSV